MKKLLTFVLALLPMIAMAQEQLNVTVDSVGQLETKIEESVRTKISELKVSGPLNGKDIKLLQ
ncbi:MAG: leucine-rich repeat domain-containing protein, partial [Prevotella sp.]|nr:leucine-rich repeat domain-containing protein [Prevotella sp.]